MITTGTKFGPYEVEPVCGCERSACRESGSPAGEIPALKPPGLSDAFDYRMDSIPRVGEHNAAILAELGLAPPRG